MLYRPKFCCNCGEKILRVEWRPWTSRRFCSFCEVEQMQHELAPKVALAVAAVFGLFGLATALRGPADMRTGDPAQIKTTTAAQLRKPRSAPAERREVEQVNADEPNSPAPAASDSELSARAAPLVQRPEQGPSSEQEVHFCGAMTKKGTLCSRRVRNGGRCWQHQRSSQSKKAKMPAAF
jgi:hypothetical protein